jgi:actin-related protein
LIINIFTLIINMYCGDDVSSVVFDIGSFQVRAGYSGEDVPRSVLPSVVGVDLDRGHQDAHMDGGIIANSSAKRIGIVVGQTELGMRRDNMDI